jgi:hypothetical protein
VSNCSDSSVASVQVAEAKKVENSLSMLLENQEVHSYVLCTRKSPAGELWHRLF